MMRACSSGRSGLWSFVRSYARTVPSSRRPSTARLSPTHALVSLRPRSMLTVAVAPEKVQSTSVPAARPACTDEKVSHRRPPTSALLSRAAAPGTMAERIRSPASWETWCPERSVRPCHVPSLHKQGVACAAPVRLMLGRGGYCHVLRSS